MSRFRLSPEQLLDIQMRAFANSIPTTVVMGKNKKTVVLSDQERGAAQHAVWYIIKRSWGMSTSVQKVTGSYDFKGKKSNVERAVRKVFPEQYFTALEKSKQGAFARALEEEEEDDETNEEQI